MHRQLFRVTAAAALVAVGACAQAGSLGSVLGGVLGAGAPTNSVSGTVQRVDTRNLQIIVQQSNGQQVAVGYDNQTQVTYQNQNYTVTSLDPGDQVTLRVQSTTSGSYYTDLVTVDRPADTSTTGTTTGAVQTLQGSVRQIDRANGLFTVDVGGNTTLTVTLPYNVSRTDSDKFQSLRTGDYVRLHGVYLNTSRVELRDFF